MLSVKFVPPISTFLSRGVDWCSGRASGSGSMGCEFPIQYTPDAANDFLHVQRSHSNKLTLKHFCGYLVNLEKRETFKR